MLRERGKVQVFSTFAFGKNVDEKVETKTMKKVITDGTKVRCGIGFTVSANFNSVRVDCAVEYPTTVDKVKEASAEAWDIVEKELKVRHEEANMFLRNLGGRR